MEKASQYEEVNGRVSEDLLPGDVNQLPDVAIEELEDQQGSLPYEELDHEDEEETNIDGEEIEKSTDPVVLYLREIGSVPLLTREREVELAKREGRGGG